MIWEFFVSKRYLLAKKQEKFISLASLISILGVAVGVAALIIVIGVMSGFDEELRTKIIGINSDLVVMTDAPVQKIPVDGLQGVKASAEFASGQAIVTNGSETTGVLLKGIDADNEIKVTDIGKYLREGRLPRDKEVIVGNEFAKRFVLIPGSELSFLSLTSKQPVELKVCGIFISGMYEYDANMVFTDLRSARQILGTGDRISGVSVRVTEPLKLEKIKNGIQRKLGYSFWVRTWMDLNRNLFSALRLEKITMFIILTLIIVVACFNIAGMLTMTVIGKTKDIGILKSIGASSASITKIFILEGFLIGAAGTAIGSAAGVWMADALGRYPIIKALGLQEIYYFDKLPVRIETADFILVAALAVVISIAATIYPAFKAARLNPVEALRYE